MTLTLRRATVDDAAAFARILGHPAVYPNLMQVPYANESLWRSRLAERTAPGKNDLMLVAERVVHGQAEVVASAGLHPRSDLPRLRHVAMIGISVAAEAQRQGVGKALMQAMCDYADRWMQILRIELEVYSDNAAAIALYRQYGFEIEATRRGYALRDGAYVDSLTMSRLHPNPPALPLPNAPALRATPPSATVQRGAASGSWTVRGCEEADLDVVAALMTRRGVVEDLPQTPWATAERVREQIGKPACSLVALTQGHVVGYASLAVQPVLRRRHAASLAIFVAPEWQGRGVGSALLAALIEWADGWAGLLRIEVDVPTQSAAAAKLLAKFGFEREGTQRAALLQDGAFVDMHSMARLHPQPPSAAAASPA
jgi:putative acetyltransferase